MKIDNNSLCIVSELFIYQILGFFIFMKVTKLFSSKANTLSFLKTQVRLSKIEYFQVITVKEWNECQKKILLNIKNNFSNKIAQTY